MFRRAAIVIAFVAVAAPAYAEVWMVKSSGVVGCRDRATLTALEAARRTDETAPPEGCMVLFSGERLLDQPEVGVGFAETLRVQRHDGSIVFVSSSAVIPDTGIGSPIDDRAE
jgi:hypothetical protein